MDLREGGRLRHGQIRQEGGQGQLEVELPDALSRRKGVSMQVGVAVQAVHDRGGARCLAEKEVSYRVHMALKTSFIFLDEITELL